ncbi:hypothetical protein F01_480360 [Burkholderia cenocepacia]|nr:hypothetical protein F01_480360 [Burkholderia cenocepacia]
MHASILSPRFSRRRHDPNAFRALPVRRRDRHAARRACRACELSLRDLPRFLRHADAVRDRMAAGAGDDRRRPRDVSASVEVDGAYVVRSVWRDRVRDEPARHARRAEQPDRAGARRAIARRPAADDAPVLPATRARRRRCAAEIRRRLGRPDARSGELNDRRRVPVRPARGFPRCIPLSFLFSLPCTKSQTPGSPDNIFSLSF